MEIKAIAARDSTCDGKKSAPDLFGHFGGQRKKGAAGNAREAEPADSLQGKKFLKDNVTITHGPSSDLSVRPDEYPSVQALPLFP